MKTRLFAIAALIAFAFTIQGCFNSAQYGTTAASYTPYPKWYGQPYAYAPYDPNGTYYYQPYQYPYPYYYEGYYDHDCGDVPCSGRPKYLQPPVEARAEPVKVPVQGKPESAPPASPEQHPRATTAPPSKSPASK